MELALGLGVLALVLMACALASGIVERVPISFPMIFIGLGFVLGPNGIGLIRLTPDNQVLHVVAVLTLSLVLFLDAVNLERAQERHALLVPLLTLGPGPLLVIRATMAASMLLLHLPPGLPLLVAPVLAPGAPGVARAGTPDVRLPTVARRALSTEAGANDAVVLPIVLVMVAVLGDRLGGATDWAAFLFKLLLLGPACGFVIGGV